MSCRTNATRSASVSSLTPQTRHDCQVVAMTVLARLSIPLWRPARQSPMLKTSGQPQPKDGVHANPLRPA